MRVVIDTNCLLASIPPKSGFYWLYEAFKAKRFEWIASNEIVAEYEEQLTTMYSKGTAEWVLSIFTAATNTTFAEPYFKWQLVVSDPDDNKFADLAISENADYLVTNDKHFNDLKKIDFSQVNVVTIQEFKKILDYR
ncbi:putative toxin-antitoxin system toxin component, PIN family [Parapedobacter sp. 2B3]|uniref:putative toxin-antitoxin system toxin component, PIN family n=1 Tax=Parapedobacter sp. 2B3 TaxID=3342381 RepID=UPI0035B5B0A4